VESFENFESPFKNLCARAKAEYSIRGLSKAIQRLPLSPPGDQPSPAVSGTDQQQDDQDQQYSFEHPVLRPLSALIDHGPQFSPSEPIGTL
jgi:hypothetical protein